MTTTTIEARELEVGDQLVRTTKAGTVIKVTLSYVGYVQRYTSDADSYDAVEWEGVSANRTPRHGLYGASEKVEVIR